MAEQLNDAEQFIYYLTGDVNTAIHWRCIHDTDKGQQAHVFYGSYADLKSTLEDYNNNGWGIHCVINVTDDQGLKIENITSVRSHFVDLDNVFSSRAMYDKAVEAGASFAVQTGENKYHVYWLVEPYQGNDFFSQTQKKLIQLFDGDTGRFPANCTMRVPGFYHLKNEPYLVTFKPHSMNRYTPQAVEQWLSGVNVFEHLSTRHELGNPEMQAPSLDWWKFAFSLIDPNSLDHDSWVSVTAAFKQSGWNHADENELYDCWLAWCAQYAANDEAENLKLWDSIEDTEVGWKSIERQTTIKAYMSFGNQPPQNLASQPPTTETAQSVSNTPNPDPAQYGEILSEWECETYFKDCYFINRTGEIFSKEGRFMNASKFNGQYGGKQFIITSSGKLTDEPWKAALRSTCWTIPKVDHVRFLPEEPTFKIVTDALGRKGLNSYIPPIIESVAGDVTPWLNHVAKLLPDPNDQHILMSYFAHNVKYPGYKIPWAPMLQGAEGIGKTVFYRVMEHALGAPYLYTPKAQELVKSGARFNSWMRGKLFIVVNEIKIDERRELIQILKPMITDTPIEIESKGVDQDKEDNPANWLFFSNEHDAIPINSNGRRYSIFYSAMQSNEDMLHAGMDINYFNNLWKWLESGGYAMITHWLRSYPIERGALPIRAPRTSSYEEVLRRTRTPMETEIVEAVEEGLPGFRGGYISVFKVVHICRQAGIRAPSTSTVRKVLQQMGYVRLGKAPRVFFQENPEGRTEVFALRSNMSLDNYGCVQGYERG